MENGSQPATKADLTAVGHEMKADLAAVRDEMIEALRDRETKLLKAFYTFAESNQKRLAETERESAAIKDRLATIESRLTEVEKRLNMPPAE